MILRYLLEGGRLMRCADAVHLADTDDVSSALADGVIQTISTEVELTLGGVTIHLAMLLDPHHWESDWEERGIEDVDAFLSGLVEPA